MGFTDVGFMQYSLVADHYQHIAIIAVIALGRRHWGIWHQGARGGAQRAGNGRRLNRSGGSTHVFDLSAKRALSATPLRCIRRQLEKNPGLLHNAQQSRVRNVRSKPVAGGN